MKNSLPALVVALALIPSAAFARDAARPDPEMLEYLGSFETAKGKPVDPLLFAEEGLVPPRGEKRKPAVKKTRQPRPENKERTEQKDGNDE
ncbi:hypothetical protein [Geobacter sp. AOG2]|uniref:hypothetical protein n=1 Tax=Geobacter sp. AOG2 TaxID=1566347 RepID=UPI001CC4D7A5|nr:hypothetical protein [Geobacter sp. AOG2]GFE61820.1 hypothetical protein AOG2_24080 [Geobacter sp. AOG2]